MTPEQFDKTEFSIYAILAGVLFNGWIQGKENENIDRKVVDMALKEIKKLLTK